MKDPHRSGITEGQPKQVKWAPGSHSTTRERKLTCPTKSRDVLRLSEETTNNADTKVTEILEFSDKNLSTATVSGSKTNYVLQLHKSEAKASGYTSISIVKGIHIPNKVVRWAHISSSTVL